MYRKTKGKTPKKKKSGKQPPRSKARGTSKTSTRPKNQRTMYSPVVYSNPGRINNGGSGTRRLVKSNSLLRPGPLPKFASSCVRIRHREYLGIYYGSSVFVNNPLVIQPGLNSTFPWLSSIASQYEQWCPLGISVDYESTSGNALTSTNTALGQIVMASNYNVLMQPYIDVESMLATEYADYEKPSKSFTHYIECNPEKTPMRLMYVRNRFQTSGDLRMSDLCTFQLASSGMQAVAAVGGIWINYDILFCKPTLNYALSQGLVDIQFLTLNCDQDATSVLYGASGPTTILNDIGGSLASYSTANYYSFPTYANLDSTYLVSFIYAQTQSGTALTFADYDIPASAFYSTNVIPKSVLVGGAQSPGRQDWLGLTDGQIGLPVLGQGTYVPVLQWDTQVILTGTPPWSIGWGGGSMILATADTLGTWRCYVRAIQLPGNYGGLY